MNGHEIQFYNHLHFITVVNNFGGKLTATAVARSATAAPISYSNGGPVKFVGLSGARIFLLQIIEFSGLLTLVEYSLNFPIGLSLVRFLHDYR